jgi:MoaA/NifB/PqqE/SkfB family radical SAM enzyme
MDRVMARLDRGERVAPAHIDMGIAKFCNVKCCFCFGFFQDVKPVYIKRETLLQTVNDAADIGVRSLAFIGDGEPTCNPHLYEALELAKERGLDMAISTNGVLVDTEEKCRTILSSCKWMRFCFSAGTREGYKEIHGKDYFDRAVANIKMMVETKKRYGYECEIGMQAVFVPTLMAEEILAESKLAVDLGVDYLVIKQCSLPDAGESGMAQFDLNLYDDKKVIEILTACQEMSTDKTDIIPKWNVMHQKGQRPYNNCPSISLISEISGNGDWCTCGYFFGGRPGTERYKFGNLHEKSLKKIWLSNEYWDAIKYMEQEFDNKTMCRGACRQDKCNEFCDIYRNKPRGINFV